MTERIVLEKPFSIKGIVVHGNALGRTVGMPTANLSVDDGYALPEDGVYGTVVEVNGEKHYAVTNVGRRPSVDDNDDVTVETHILGFDMEIYGCSMSITFVFKIRPVIKFGSLEEVKAQVEKDKAEALSYFGKNS